MDSNLTLHGCIQFVNANMFNVDVSSWDVSSLEYATRMFLDASSFNQNLCEWSQTLPENTNVAEMFKDTKCSDTNDPSPSVGPFCHVCGKSLYR
jgi:Mycoplasma protein of unknown function, DUF285